MLSSSLTASHLAVACLIGLLCWAAFSDFLQFIIPNQVCVAVAALAGFAFGRSRGAALLAGLAGFAADGVGRVVNEYLGDEII